MTMIIIKQPYKSTRVKQISIVLTFSEVSIGDMTYEELRGGLSSTTNADKELSFLNDFTAVGALRALIDFTLSNARRFYMSMGIPLAMKGLMKAVRNGFSARTRI